MMVDTSEDVMCTDVKADGDEALASEQTGKERRAEERKRKFLEAKKAKEQDPEYKAKKLRERAVAALALENRAIPFLHELRPELDYQVVSSEQPVPQASFKIQVDIDGVVCEGEGNTKRKAKAAAAEKALELVIAQLNLGDLTEEIEAARKAAAEKPAAEEPANGNTGVMGKSPTSLLIELKGALTFEIVTIEQVEGAPPTNKHFHRMSITIDDMTFTGEGTSKKMAKAKASEQALNKIYGIRCFTDSGNMPWFVGQEPQWMAFRKADSTRAILNRAKVPTLDPVAATLPFQLPGNKNPIMFLHELYPQTTFSFPEETKVEGQKQTYTCTVRVEDFDFYGEAMSKKTARMNAAIAALTAIESAGILSQRIAEQKSHKAAVPKWQPAKRAMFEQNGSGGGRQFGLSAVRDGSTGSLEGVGLMKRERMGGEAMGRNAVMRMNEIQGGLSYRDVAQSSEKDVNGQLVHNFTVAIDYNGKTYSGSGSSKKVAKNAAAEMALRDLGRWTLEDEQIKTSMAAAEKASKANAGKFGNGGGQGWRGRGGGQSRGGRGRGVKPWVSGGILHANPGTPLQQQQPSGGYFDNPGYHAGMSGSMDMYSAGATGGGFGATGGGFGATGGGFGAASDGAEYLQDDPNLSQNPGFGQYSSWNNRGGGGGGFGGRGGGGYQAY